MTLLSAQSVTRTFSDFVALDSLSLTLDRGEIVGLIGPSGGGKTTAVRLLAGIDTPTSGQASIFGRTAGRLRRKDRARVGMLSQDPALIEDFSIAEHVRFVARLRRMPSSEVDRVLERVGLEAKSKTRIAEASGGMKRRAGLAAALIADPELVFCDEPTAGLDPILREQVWDWFTERREQGRAMLVTTQHITEAVRCDRIVVLRSGSVIFDDVPSALAHEAGLDEFIDVGIAHEDQPEFLQLLKQHGKRAANLTDNSVTIAVPNAATAMADLTEWLAPTAIQVLSLETREPDLDSVFRELVEGV